MPGEYAAIGRPGGPEPWKVTDIIATASLVGGIFGKGGGDELTQMELRRSFRARYGARRGERLWREWAAYEDADAPTHVKPSQALPLPDAAEAARPRRDGDRRRGLAAPARTSSPRARAAPRRAASVGGRRPAPAGSSPTACARWACPTRSSSPPRSPRAAGRSPCSGPQTAYFAPQILMEQDVHAPGIDARGAAFPGVNLYVQLGRGQDYAWSATSAGQDIIDTFAVDLCEPDGGKPTTESMHYRLPRRSACRSRCSRRPTAGRRRSPTRRRRAACACAPSARSSASSPAARRSRASRSPTPGCARRTCTRSTPRAGSRSSTTPTRCATRAPSSRPRTRSATRSTGSTSTTATSRTSTRATTRSARRASPASCRCRRGWSGAASILSVGTAAYTSFAKHPQAINGQPYMTSWNNKQARGYAGADTNLFSSVFRSQMLDQEIEARIAGPAKIDLPGLVEAMGEAATTDLRAEQVLPLALRVIGAPADPKMADAVAKLRAWVADGAHRRDRDGDGRLRARRRDPHPRRVLAALDARAVRAARWASELFEDLTGAHELDNTPNNHGVAPGLGLPGRLVRLRVQGPAPRARAEGAPAVLQALLRRRACARAVAARCAARWRRRSTTTPRTLYRDATCTEAGKPVRPGLLRRDRLPRDGRGSRSR